MDPITNLKGWSKKFTTSTIWKSEGLLAFAFNALIFTDEKTLEEVFCSRAHRALKAEVSQGSSVPLDYPLAFSPVSLSFFQAELVENIL